MFTPRKEFIRKGDTVEIDAPLETFSGTYSKGHKFTYLGTRDHEDFVVLRSKDSIEPVETPWGISDPGEITIPMLSIGHLKIVEYLNPLQKTKTKK